MVGNREPLRPRMPVLPNSWAGWLLLTLEIFFLHVAYNGRQRIAHERYGKPSQGLQVFSDESRHLQSREKAETRTACKAKVS